MPTAPNDALEAVGELIRVLTTTDDDFTPAFREAYRRCAAKPVREELDEAARLIFRAAEQVPCPLAREVMLYVVTGALIELGGTVELGWPWLQRRLAEGVRVLCTAEAAFEAGTIELDEGTADGEVTAEQRDWAVSFRHLVVAAMARVARSPALRQQLREVPGFVDDVERLHAAAGALHTFYISEVLQLFDGRLLVIDTIGGRTELLECEGVRNCAHLIALLEGADTRTLGSTAGAMYSVKFDAATFGCLDETPEGLRDVDWVFMLPVDLRVNEVPAFDVLGVGPVRVVVRAPRRLGSRSFSAPDFFAPVHDACVEAIRSLRSFEGPDQSALLGPIVREARALRAELGRIRGHSPFDQSLTSHRAWAEHWASGVQLGQT